MKGVLGSNVDAARDVDIDVYDVNIEADMGIGMVEAILRCRC